VQTRDNPERMVIVLVFIEVRVLSLRQGGLSEEALTFTANCSFPA